MIEEILSDLEIKSEPLPMDERFLHKCSDKIIFEKIERLLHENEIKSGYTLGTLPRLGEDASFALLKHRGYWVVLHMGERATRSSERQLCGIFLGAYHAVDFFLCRMLNNRYKCFDWGWLYD